MVSSGRDFLLVAPHIATIPGLAIMLAVLGFNLSGTGCGTPSIHACGPGLAVRLQGRAARRHRRRARHRPRHLRELAREGASVWACDVLAR